jgi:hypothetical protein
MWRITGLMLLADQKETDVNVSLLIACWGCLLHGCMNLMELEDAFIFNLLSDSDKLV